MRPSGFKFLKRKAEIIIIDYNNITMIRDFRNPYGKNRIELKIYGR